MTNERAKEILTMLICQDTRVEGDDYEQALDMAIKALSQEPCDDAISRKDAEQMFRNIRDHLKPQDYKSAEEFNTRDLMLLNAEQMIHALPSVTQKSGKWIHFAQSDDCPFCGYSTGKYESPSKYCPDCGARLKK